MAQKYNKERLFEMMQKVDPTFKSKLNENDAFNDAGEPLMTHQQYNDYGEPSEPDYNDSRNDYEEEQTPNSIVKEIEKHFDTILETYNDKEYTFLTKGIDGDIIVFFNGNVVSGHIDIPSQNINKEFPKQDVDELDVYELFQFFEPYRQYILSGQEAEKEMTNISKRNTADAQYARQERAATGGLGESSLKQTINPKYTHFAVTKDTNQIVNGWDYNGIEPVELRQFKKDYFFTDLTDMGIDTHNIKVVTTKYLQSSGINPFDMSNWNQSTNESFISEDRNGFKRLSVFDIYDKNRSFLGSLDPIDERERGSEFHQGTVGEILATPEFQKFAKEQNISAEQIGSVKRDYEYFMNNVRLSREYYAPSDSEELYDTQNDAWYNLSGQQMRDPSEYARGGSNEDGYTPFGDEGDGNY